MRQHVRQRIAHDRLSNSVRLLDEKHIRCLFQRFTALRDKWYGNVASRVFKRVRARGRTDLDSKKKANLATRGEIDGALPWGLVWEQARLARTI